MAMFYKNVCQFGQCNLEFANVYDLIQHIEETHIPLDAEKKPDTQAQVACAPLSAICRYFQRLPDQPARPIIPEPTFQHPSPLLASAAHAAAVTVKKRLPSIIAQSSATQSATGSLIAAGGQNLSQMPLVPSSSSLFHPPANVAPLRSSGATPASHTSEPDDESMSVGHESFSSESSVAIEESNADSSASYKIISPTDSNDERRYICTAPGCKKRYKNMNGIRYHTRIAHAGGATIDTQANAKKFRCQCGKAYKTSHGLHNHMLQTQHRQAPVPASSSTLPRPGIGGAAGNMSGVARSGTKYPAGMAGVSASASQFKRGLSLSMMSGGGAASSATSTKQVAQGPPSSLNSAYYGQQSGIKSGGSGGGGSSSSTATLPSGVSVQVSNLGGGAPTTVQVGQQGALGFAAASSVGTGGSAGPSIGGGQGLHISASRRLATASHHHAQQQNLHSIGSRQLKIHSAASSSAGGVVVSAPAGVNAYNASASMMTTGDRGTGHHADG